jgi:hypothetical protein
LPASSNVECDTVKLVRTSTGDQGTLGVACVNGDTFVSLELPWRENNRSVSCIPPGIYLCTLITSKKYGEVYYVNDVPNRSGILIHAGNFAGDLHKGLRSDSKGCILLGNTQGSLGGQQCILESRKALKRFMQVMCRKDFLLEIYNQPS